ncbi:polycystin family receptor for egg jelly-like [Pogona vitticeps]
MMRCLFCLVLLFCRLCFPQYQAVTLSDFLPPPLSVTCSKPENRVYQRQDNDLRISCLWDRYIVMRYSRVNSGKEINHGKEEPDFQSPPYCQWYRDSILVNTTNHWSGHLTLGSGLAGEGPHPPWAYSQITVQCTSAMCEAPLCFYHNLSIQVSGQDVRLFLFWPHTVPVFEWQPVQLGWCARLKSSTWIYHFRSRKGSPADILIPSNQYSDPPPFAAYPNAELYRVCRSYYNYHLTVRYPRRGIHTASVSIEDGPPISLSMDFFVEPALLHVFSANSKLLSHPHGTLHLSWRFLPLSQGTVTYKLLDMQGRRGWSRTYNYNPFSLHRNFCAVHTPHNSKEKVVASIYFHTNENLTEELTGQLNFSNETLIFSTSSAAPIYLALNPAKIKLGTYIVSHTLGLFYSTQESATGNNSSSHYIFYQQASFSYLLIAEFLQLQLFRFSMHIYLNRNGTLFKSLGEKEFDIHVFNSSSLEERLFYIVWFIPVQHPLLQCEWTFNLQLFDSRVKYPIQNDTFTYLDQVRNATHFIPDSYLPFSPAMYTGFVAKVKCTSNYSMPITLKATFNTYASKIIESRIACQYQHCSITDINIQKSSTSKHIMYYTQGTEFTVTADAQINCPGQKQTHIVWNIYKVPNMAHTPNWSKPFNPPGIGKRNVATLKVPSSSLDCGLYLFNFTMKLTSLDTWDTKIASDSVFIEIGPDNLVAVIDGGNFRTVRFSEQWALNGSAFSNGNTIQPSEELTFTWYCTKQKTDYISMTLSRNKKCHPDQVGLKWISSSDPIQIVQPQTLPGNTLYYFLLVVQNGSRTAQTEQTVSVQGHSALILNVTCIENCGTSVIPTERFCLSGKCLNCKTIKPLYRWSLHSAKSSEIDFDWSSKTTTGRSNSYLHINAFAFVSRAEQSYILSLTIVTKDGESATYKYFFYVNGPPQIGKCVLNPRTGTAFLTKFIIQCNGFEDKNGPLTYKVIAAANQKKTGTISSIENSTLGIIVYAGQKHKTPHFFLPVGMPSANSALIIYVQVYDSLGACSQVTLQATVRNQRKSKSADIVHQKLYALLGRQDAPMTNLPLSENHLKTGYFIYTMASLLNNIKVSSTIQSSKTDLRQTLLNMIAGIPTMDVQEINQVILSICQVTYETNEVNRESQLLAVRKLKEVSEALKRHRDIGSKQTEILGSGIFTGLSNVLTASLLSTGNINVAVVRETILVMEILADLILQGKVPGEHETHLETKYWTIHLRKDEKWDISGSLSDKKYCRNCFHPKLKESHHPELQVDAIVSTAFYEFEINPFPWLLFTKDIGTVVAGFKMTGTKSNGDTVSITPDVAEVIMARKDGGLFDLTVGPDKKLSKTTGGFSFEIRRGSKDVFIQIVSKIKITFQVFIYLGHNISHPPVAIYIVSHHSPPIANKTQNNITDCEIKAPYILCLPHSLFWPQVSNNAVDKLNISIVLQSHPIVRDRTTKIVRIALFAAECLDLVGIQSQWKEGTCSLGHQTSWSKIHCICEAREPTTRKAIPRPAETSGIRFLASKVALFPSQVDKERSLLSETGQNPVTWWTVFAIFITYIFLAIYVLGKDKIRKRDCIIDLPDNDPFDKTRYLLTIYTGSRLRAGTQATVFIQLTGQNGVSDVHQLKHPLFPRNFHRGAVNTFLLTTEMDLGELSSLRVWHNNCYFGSNWYLSRVKVQNTDTKQSWLFMCRKWFALGKDDCQIERTFPVTNPNVPLSTIDTFLIMVSHGLSNDHLWLSVFAHSIDDSFSRFQRLSCCLAILLSSLVFNIMFFSIEYEQHVHLVDLQTLRSIRIGIQSALMSIPVELIVTTLFKYSVKKPSWCNRDPQVKEKSSFLSESSSKEASLKDAPLTKKKSKPFSLMDLNANNNAAKKETFSEKIQKPQLLLCFLVIAWSFVFCTSGLSSFFIILHGLSYDEKTSFEWLIASLTSFCLSVFLFETVKIVAIAAWNTGSAKFCAKLPWLRYPDIQFHGRIMTMEEMAQSHRELLRLRASKQYQPINEEELTVLRRIEKIKNLGYIFVKNMLCHLVFLTLILNATHPAEITNSFYYNQLMYNRFSVGLSKVHTIEDIYNWVKDIFVPLIHNEYQPTYLLNTWSKVLGLPRMRQIRSTDSISTCYFPHGLANTYILSGTHCQKKYGIDPEDQTNYFGSWAMPVNSSLPNYSSGFLGFTFEHPTTQWEYNSYGELNSYPSRGYSFYFFPGEPKANSTTRLKTLETSNWLDDKTWALIVELTTFNPDADLFCSISIIFESSDIGSVNSSVSVHSYRLPLFSDQSKSQILLLLGTIYMLIVYIADECRVLYQKRLRYISTAANIINFGIKTTCTVFLVLLLFKFKLAFDLVQFYLQHQERFIPFHAVSQFDQVIRIIMGFLAFLLVLKMYRYFRFLYGVRLAQKSLYAAIPTMINLSIAGGIFFFAYMSLGYLGFGQHEWNFHNVIYSFTTILSYCALAFRNTEFSSDEFLGGLFLGSFMVVMICVFVNLSQVILISSHVDMKIPVYEHHSHEAEIIYYIVQKIYRGWFFATTGSQTTTETHIFNRLLFGKPRRTFRLLD